MTRLAVPPTPGEGPGEKRDDVRAHARRFMASMLAVREAPSASSSPAQSPIATEPAPTSEFTPYGVTTAPPSTLPGASITVGLTDTVAPAVAPSADPGADPSGHETSVRSGRRSRTLRVTGRIMVPPEILAWERELLMPLVLQIIGDMERERRG